MEWITKLGGHTTNADVSISKGIPKEDRYPRFNIRFRNGSYASITNNKRIVYAFVSSRIYFKQSNEAEGYSLTGFGKDNKSCSTMVTVMNDEFIGDYPLQYDGARKLYFIDTNSKIKY